MNDDDLNAMVISLFNAIGVENGRLVQWFDVVKRKI